MSDAADRLIEALLPYPPAHREGGTERADALLTDDPQLARANIFTAAMTGERDHAEALLQADPNLAVTRGGPKNWDPLLYLCFSRYLRTDDRRAERMTEIARRLLELGADPNTHWLGGDEPPGARESALYGAAGIANRVALAQLLIEAGGDPNDEETPYHMVEHDGVPSADLIFPRLDPAHRATALLHKLDYPDLDGIRKLLELGADPNADSRFENFPVHQATFRGHPREIFDLLFEHGADPNRINKRGKTAYAMAARAGRREIMGWLVDRGASIELDEPDRFIGACALADAATVESLLAAQPERIAKLDDRDRSMICDAADAGNVEGVRTMLDAGWDVNTRGHVWGEGAIHRAAIQGHDETVALLLDRGADLTLRDRSYGSSPLGWAEHGGERETLKLLLADPSRLDLRDAIEYGQVERARELMAEVEPDAAVLGGEPGVLLRSAANSGQLELVRDLLERGADPSLRNSEGARAIDYARLRGHTDIADLLSKGV